MTDTVLVLAWVVFAHLVADFVLQNDWIAINKATGGRNGWLALSVHGFHVGLCLVPVVLAFGLPGIVYLVLVVVTHMIVDSWKVQATRQAEAAGREQARARIARTGAIAESGLGSAWTPWPGLLFLADQALHMTFALVGWLVILQGVALLPQFVDFVNRVLGSWDRATVHAVVLTGVVVLSLFIVNTRGAYYFILALVSPRELPPDERAGAAAVGAAVDTAPAPAADPPPVAEAPASDATSAPPIASPAPAVRETPGGPVPPPTVAVPSGAPAKIGATIGALERLLIVAFILVGAEAAVGFVIAAKTLARFKQLDDRGFAEYYLLGTLASVSVAVFTALVAQAALQTIP